MLLRRQRYSSGLAAALLQEIGFVRAANAIGGAEARIAAGLAVEQVVRAPRYTPR